MVARWGIEKMAIFCSTTGSAAAYRSTCGLFFRTQANAYSARGHHKCSREYRLRPRPTRGPSAPWRRTRRSAVCLDRKARRGLETRSVASLAISSNRSVSMHRHLANPKAMSASPRVLKSHTRAGLQGLRDGRGEGARCFRDGLVQVRRLRRVYKASSNAARCNRAAPLSARRRPTALSEARFRRTMEKVVHASGACSMRRVACSTRLANRLWGKC